jgi:xanthine dehydrogenase accessory factor
MAKVWARIRDTIDRHGIAALVSVIDVDGSAPREAGARLMVQPDGGFFGTIGGGRLEFEAIAAARATLAKGRGQAEFRNWPLGPNLGQCCGGRVRTLTETFDPRDAATVRRLADAEQSGTFVTMSRLGDDGRIARVLAPHAWAGAPPSLVKRGLETTGFREQFGETTTPVLLFGAGHVGRAVVLALAPLPFAVRWIDSRPDQFPHYVPPNVVTVRTDDAERELAEAPGDAMVVVMTHAHPLDFDITVAALRRGAFDFVGLIGSETKRARFVTFARQMGVTAAELDRLTCPIGIPEIKGKEPAVIAASLAAQLLILTERASQLQESPPVASEPVG